MGNSFLFFLLFNLFAFRTAVMWIRIRILRGLESGSALNLSIPIHEANIPLSAVLRIRISKDPK